MCAQPTKSTDHRKTPADQRRTLAPDADHRDRPGSVATDGMDTDSVDSASAPVGERLRTFCLCGLLLLGTIAALYLAQVVILPIVLAIVLKLLLQPLMRHADRVHLSRVLAAFVITLCFVALIGALFTTLS